MTQRTSGDADEYEPAWSPDGSEIAFASGTGANATAIQAVNAAGKMRTLATAPAGAHLNSPSWSPDGTQVSYIQFAANISRLMIAGHEAVADNDVFPFPATWLGGGKIAYAGNGKIHVADLATHKAADVPFSAEVSLDRAPYQRKRFDLASTTPQQAKGIVSPALSPDGKHIVFEALNQLWLMEIGKPQPLALALTNDKFYKEDPAWSPDGKSIAYSSDKAGTEDLYILDIASKSEKRVAFAPDSAANSAEVSAAWSPDGTKLAWQDQDGATYIVDIASGRKQLLIPAQFAPSKPSWSAGGRTVAICALKPYTKRYREGTSQILAADVATGRLTYSEPAPFKSLSTRGEDGPVYSPDGQSMAFVMDSQLWIRPVDKNGIPAGPARQINREVTDAPTWSGDSKTLLYLSNGKLRIIGADGSNLRTIPLDLTWQREIAPARTVIHAGRLWNGLGATEQTDVDITVANGRIVSIARHSAGPSNTPPPAGTTLIDSASALTVVPGLLGVAHPRMDQRQILRRPPGTFVARLWRHRVAVDGRSCVSCRGNARGV